MRLLSAQDIYKNIHNWVLLVVDLDRYFITWGYNNLGNFPASFSSLPLETLPVTLFVCFSKFLPFYCLLILLMYEVSNFNPKFEEQN